MWHSIRTLRAPPQACRDVKLRGELRTVPAGWPPRHHSPNVGPLRTQNMPVPLSPVNDDPLADIRGMRIAHLGESDGPGRAERMLALLAVAFHNAGCEDVVFLPNNGESCVQIRLSDRRVDAVRFRFRAFGAIAVAP